jgi:hypothetical protein
MKHFIRLLVVSFLFLATMLPAQEEPAKSEAPPGDAWTKAVKEPAKRGTLHDAFQRVRGDSGKWNEEARLGHAPPISQKPLKLALDDWADQLQSEKTPGATAAEENWLLFKTRQLDDNDRVWVERIERRGNQFTITLHEAIWQGRYSKTFTYYSVFGVNLGKLPPGDYEAKWIVKPLEFREFAGTGRPVAEQVENGSKDEKPSAKKPSELSVAFTVVEAPR